jgi:hypothetical protein
MDILQKRLHDVLARNICDGIRLKQLQRGTVVTHEISPGHFGVMIAVATIVPAESITVQLDLAKIVAEMSDRATFEDTGV